MKPLVVASNMFNEIDQVEGWYENMCLIADAGILIVDTGSTDGTREFFESKENVVFITDDIILREGYGPARNQLRDLSIEHFPSAHWMIYLDGDERIMEEDFHKLRFLKSYLSDAWDIIALPRLNRLNKDTLDTKVDFHIHPDYQARMSRLLSELQYVRKLHEQVVGSKGIYAEMGNPKIHHFHRSTDQKKRDYIGRMCAKLHAEDEDFGHTYPVHHKEEYYYKQLQEIGLHGDKL